MACQLAQEWEDKLRAHRRLHEEYARLVQTQPRSLSAAEREAIVHRAHNVPALWHAPTTTMAERKEIVRQITMAWSGGGSTVGVITRPISRSEHLRDDPRLCERIRALAQAG